MFCTTTTWNNVKFPSCTSYGRNVVGVPVRFFFFFFHCSSCSLWWPRALLIFSPPLLNVFLPKKFVSFVALYLFSTSVKTLKFSESRREDSALPPKRAGGWNAMFHSCLHEGWMYIRTILSEPKFLGYIDKQIFLLMVLRCARDSSGKIIRCKGAQWRPKE